MILLTDSCISRTCRGAEGERERRGAEGGADESKIELESRFFRQSEVSGGRKKNEKKTARNRDQ